MYGMDVNPLAHTFHLQGLERETLAMSEQKDHATHVLQGERRRAGIRLLKAIPFRFLARRKAYPTEA